MHFVMEDDIPETCPWSLSGPQFPTPTAMQQRYCYPKGRPEYSSRKGGALWTMYGADGREDVEYRLLHVYFSAKRAHNKSMGDIANESPSVRKRSSQYIASSPGRALSKQRIEYHHLLHDDEAYNSPVITTSSFSPSSLCSSPLSFTNAPYLPFPGASAKGDNGSLSWPDQLIVTPINDIVEKRNEESAPQPQARAFDRQGLYQHYLLADNNDFVDGPVPSPFRGPIKVPLSTINVKSSPLLRTGDNDDDTSISSDDLFGDLEFPMQGEIDAFWDDPLTSIMMTDEMEHRHSPSHVFALKLESLQDTIRERILAAPISEQPQLVSIMAAWAKQMAIEPLTVATAACCSGDAPPNDGSEMQS